MGQQPTLLCWPSAAASQKKLHYGVAQGSVLGPVLFTLYIQPLSEVVSRSRCLLSATLTLSRALDAVLDFMLILLLTSSLADFFWGVGVGGGWGGGEERLKERGTRWVARLCVGWTGGCRCACVRACGCSGEKG